MHDVTESQSNYTSHEIQNLCLFFLNLIRDKDRRFSERLSCEASRSSLTIDSVRDASVRNNVCLNWTWNLILSRLTEDNLCVRAERPDCRAASSCRLRD